MVYEVLLIYISVSTKLVLKTMHEKSEKDTLHYSPSQQVSAALSKLRAFSANTKTEP